MSRATPADDQFGAPIAVRAQRSDDDALNRKLSPTGVRPSMKDMRERQPLSRRPPVVRERFDVGTPISELQGDRSKTPEYAMDFHKDPFAPAVGPTGEIDQFAHLTDAQTPVIHTYGFSGFNDPMKERLSAMRQTDNPQSISPEFYPEESGMDFRLDRMSPSYPDLHGRHDKLFRRSSDTPTDVAFSVLKPEEEVRKIFPLAAALPYVVPALMAAYGTRQGVKNVRENKVTDPVLGVVSREGDDSALSNLAEFGTGFAQGFVPGKAAKAGARAGGKALAGRTAKRAAQKEATRNTQRAATERALTQQYMGQGMNRAGATKHAQYMSRQIHPTTPISASPGIGSRTLTGLGQPMGRLAPAVAVGGGIAYAGKQIADALGNMSVGGGGAAAPSGSGMGGSQQQQGQFSLAGDPSAGNQNLQNVGVGQTGREQIWQQGGSGTFDQKQKGETMTFTHYDGNEMLRKTLEDLDKMHCGTEQKAEEDKGGKKSKKPAHGMVIVIGSKGSGPGPSTNGKRDSKD